MYSTSEIIHILVSLIYFIYILCSSFLIILYTQTQTVKSYYFKNRLQSNLYIATLGIITSSPFDLLVLGVSQMDNNICTLLRFNIHYLFSTACMLSYSYRGIKIYFEHIKLKKILITRKNINTKLKYFKFIFIIIYILLLIYTIIINIIFYNDKIDFFNWKYYPYFLIIGIYDLIIHPIIIYLLLKIKVRKDIINDYTCSMVVIFITFGLFIINNFILLNNSNINKNLDFFLQFFIKYWTIIATFFIYTNYNFIPLLYIIKNDASKIVYDIKIGQKYNYKTELKSYKIDFINKYNELFVNSNDNRKLDIYIKFYNNNIKQLKPNYLNIIEKIENDIENNIINFENFKELNNEVMKNILEEIYNP